ncbi:MAG TPA: metallopeptidase family protein [Terriglobia bacterium]|nr:metallopeptidase family protein [Terriglobia bacterium]
MRREDFEKLVDAAVTDLPEEFRSRLENVALLVESRPTRAQLASLDLEPDDELFGLYEGTPLTERGFEAPLHPDRIWIFQEPIERVCVTRREIQEEIRITIMHEIAHFFGIDDNALEDMGY